MEIRETHLIDRKHEHHAKEVIFLFTPLCGTCKLAEKMLQIALKSGITAPIRKLNINFAPTVRDSWQITSVPCLVLLRGGKPVKLEYRIQSVGYLYEMLKRFMNED
ncbi:thioredoxin family protein [Paenibacillus tarimensis]